MLKHDMCQPWEEEIARLKSELDKAHKVIVGLCDMTVDVITSLKAMDDNVEIEAALKNIIKLKNKYTSKEGMPL